MVFDQTGIALLWTKVLTESTFLEVTTAVTIEGKSTTTPYPPTHGLITGRWVSDFQSKVIYNLHCRLSIIFCRIFLWNKLSIEYKKITVNFCGPHSWTLPVESSPRKMEPGSSSSYDNHECQS